MVAQLPDTAGARQAKSIQDPEHRLEHNNRGVPHMLPDIEPSGKYLVPIRKYKFQNPEPEYFVDQQGLRYYLSDLRKLCNRNRKSYNLVQIKMRQQKLLNK